MALTNAQPSRRWLAAYVVLSVLAGFNAPSRAERASLSSGEIKETVSGATIHLDTPLGIALPLVFNPDGSVLGTAGRLAFYLGSASDRGKWWISNSQLCQKWSKWFDGETSCMQIVKNGSKFQWQRDDGKSGTAKIVSRQTVARSEPQQPTPGQPLARASIEATSFLVPTPVLVSHGTRAEYLVAGSEARDARSTMGVVAPEETSRIARLVHPASASAVQLRVVGVQSVDVLNIRARPSAEALVVGVVPPGGRSLDLLGACLRAWCLIRYGNVVGWANAGFLQPEVPVGAAAAKVSTR